MSTSALDTALSTLPGRYIGPGGAIAVLRHGELLARHTWGWSDVERRIPFTPETMFLVCSITKQFTCALMLDQHPDPTVLDADIAARMPLLANAPGITHLAHNQSGLRDYWATAMLCGAPVEGVFTEGDAQRLIARTSSLHFAPGTRYSYCNQNFRLIGDVTAARAGRPYADLLRQRILAPAGMQTAHIAPDTAQVPGGTVGYEGTPESGFRPAVNNIIWTGDAGLAASLDDMIAWERHIDAHRDDPKSLYLRQSAPVHFADGALAGYGYGLARMKLFGRDATGHGGGLRGWRSFRFYIPSERISVVAMFNHMTDPRGAALEILAALLGETPPTPPATPAPAWTGRYFEPETGLATRIEPAGDGKLKLSFAAGADQLSATQDGAYTAGAMRLEKSGDTLRMIRPTDNLACTLTRVDGPAPHDNSGTFHNPELDATLTVIASGGGLYGAFSGELGDGAMVPLLPHGPDIWLLPMPRALDSAAPGDWTLAFTRSPTNTITSVTIGCWLARNIPFTAQ
jgi:D-aminopeptidase